MRRTAASGPTAIDPEVRAATARASARTASPSLSRTEGERSVTRALTGDAGTAGIGTMFTAAA